MSIPTRPAARRGVTARTAGAFYLAFIVAAFLADQIGHIGLSNEDALADLIATSEERFRAGLAIALVSLLFFVLAAWALAEVLRPAGRGLALLLLVLNAVGAAVHAASLVVLSVGLAAGAGNAVAVAIEVHSTGVVAAQVFFSAWLFPLGVLLLRSRIVPRALAWLVLLDGVAVAWWFGQAMLLPDSPAFSYPAWAVSFAAEAGLALWLLVRGGRTDAADAAPSAP
ncbi:DUF4386 domain-containing protein [Demequina subtropica]|uniref:DUF4386 domain-containing protein n=1 Tax=Demequina subtropica TaxID=1638989 RepID=UPI0007828302|nr:DUF4386 domain-containing protein [Demequina subtropica]